MEGYKLRKKLSNKDTGEVVTIEDITIRNGPAGEALWFALKSKEKDMDGNPHYYNVTLPMLEEYFIPYQKSNQVNIREKQKERTEIIEERLQETLNFLRSNTN